MLEPVFNIIAGLEATNFQEHAFLQKTSGKQANVLVISFLTSLAPTPQNGQTLSNNWSAGCQRIFGVCLTILWGWRLKG